MLGLIPRDYWEHHFVDVRRGFAAAIRRKDEVRTINLAGLADCLPVTSGRAALVAAIKALGLPKGSRIGVPLYCCSVVFKAIAAADCVPRFIDIDPDTYCLSVEDLSAKASEVDAVVAVHLFGNICDIRRVKEAAPGKPIIEDCAQSLGSKIENRPVGSLGTLSFFSFRSSKYLSVGEGGAIFADDPDIRSRLFRIIATMPRRGRIDELIHVARVYLKSVLRGRPFYGLMGYRLWNYVNKELDAAANPRVTMSQIRRADLAIAEIRLSSLDQAIRRQRAHAEFYARALALDSGMLCLERPGLFYNRFHYPITFPSTAVRDAVAAFLLRRNIDGNKYLDAIVDVATRLYGYTGGCPVAERISKRVLTIPIYHTLRKHDIQRIADDVNEGWAQVSNRFKDCA
jgi:perosamine synthetase